MRKEEETKQVNQSKISIAQSVKRISDYNSTYISELKKKDYEIDELKRRLSEAQHRYSDKYDDSETDEGINVKEKPRYKELREEIIGKRDANMSTVSSNSVLESAKKYVASARSGIPKTIGYGHSNGGIISNRI